MASKIKFTHKGLPGQFWRAILKMHAVNVEIHGGNLSAAREVTRRTMRLFRFEHDAKVRDSVSV